MLLSAFSSVSTFIYGNKHLSTKNSKHNMMQSHVKAAKKSLLYLLIQKHLGIKVQLCNTSARLRPIHL